MLLTDRNNNSVKLVSLLTSSLVSQVSVPGCPWDMCLLPCERVAISVYDVSANTGSIQFLDTREQKISLGKSMTMDKQCRGIGYNNDCLIVSYFSGELEKMDLEGRVLKKVSYRSSEHDIENPFYLTVVIEDQTAEIYVSDSNTNTITKLDMDLSILQTFRDPVLRDPRGITAVENQLLISGLASNNIVQLDLPSGQMTQLLGEDEGIQGPDSVCYNQQQTKLYVTCIPLVGISDFNFVKVYWKTGTFY
ncbi:uncharacterized protein LOC128237293 [Mya arenaria]|uniref:uncharacterized protein LOC128237293 n=1 Tax=Mya arenaria TaxID=6604 RepID=UPI0022E74637|nr:uncharacterized protein LOC128237293 [Mya arenaria]